jgi:predicted DsbA family dithiol-disulfide isomerase
LRHIAVLTYYYTDPACPWSWALEPTLRRLSYELGDTLEIRYVMCGMAREFTDRTGLIADALEASEASDMPVDARLWLEGSPRSSHPACIAVKAAAEQGDPAPYLRRLREGFMCRRRKLDTAEALTEEARGIGGLDLERFRVDLGSHAVLEAFGADLDRSAAAPAEHQSPGTGRIKLPSLEFLGEAHAAGGAYGYSGYAELRDAALAAGARPVNKDVPSVEEALARFGSMATAEVAAVCELPGPRAPAELWRLAAEWRVKPEHLGSGELWSLA